VQEIRARREGNTLVVQEYVVGIRGALERLAALGIASGLLRTVSPRRRLHVVGWQQMDISDPLRPRLLVPASRLAHDDARDSSVAPAADDPA